MKRGLIAIFSAALVLALSVLPAAANNQIPPHVAGGAFDGTATLAAAPPGSGLYYPVGTTCNGGGPGLCPGKNATWTLAIPAGGGVGGHYRPPGPGQGAGTILGIETENSASGGASVAVGTFSAVAGIVGAVGPGTAGYGAWCGYSSGWNGDGDIVFAAPAASFPPAAGVTIGVTGVGWQQSAATVIVFHGRVNTQDSTTDNAHGTIDGVVSAIPPAPVPGSPSCANATSITFRVVGAAVSAWHNGLNP